MNKRENLFSLIDANRRPDYIPAAFFLHFDPAFHRGQAAVGKHLEYFRYTGMDLVKIQYEHNFPALEFLQAPEDWARVPLYKEDFFAEPLEVVKGLVQAAKDEAVVVVTLYSPFMFAGQAAGSQRLARHLDQDPEAVRPGLEAITESVLHFVRGCMRAGVDGFYASTQGGEAGRFRGAGIFEQYVKPFDLLIWDEIKDACPFNILHVCDYSLDYDDLSPFLDYPGQVVNASLKVGGKHMTPKEMAALFGRPFMGGMERKGALAGGDPGAIREAALEALEGAPERFILAADCTVPPGTPWEGLKAAINTAHGLV